MKQQNNTSVPLLGHRDCFYHVTEAENVSSIMQNGLRCGDDLHIYLITELNLDAVMHIAASQSAIKTPVIIEVCALGITAKLKPDNVAELFASQQLRVRQSIIPPQFLTVVCSVAMDPGYSSTGSRVAGSNARWRAVVAASMQKFAADNAAALPALQAVDRAWRQEISRRKRAERETLEAAFAILAKRAARVAHAENEPTDRLDVA